MQAAADVSVVFAFKMSTGKLTCAEAVSFFPSTQVPTFKIIKSYEPGLALESPESRWT